MNTDREDETSPSNLQGLESALLSSIVASSTDAIISKTLDGIITSWNAAATRTFGYLPEEIVGQHITVLIPDELRSQEDEILWRLRRGERIEHFDTVRKTKDGRLIPVSLTISPMRDGHGRIVGASKIARNITERKRNEERQKLLVSELRHRVKNMLGTVGSIARQSFKGPEHTNALAQFSQRLVALATGYDYLINEGREHVGMDEVVLAVLAPFMSEDCRIVIDPGPKVILEPGQATSIALAVNELATNAMKYGALSNGDGHVVMQWRSAEDGGIDLSWIERDGPEVQPPSRSGFGTQILKHALKYDLNAETTLDFARTGFRFHMRFPPA